MGASIKVSSAESLQRMAQGLRDVTQIGERLVFQGAHDGAFVMKEDGKRLTPRRSGLAADSWYIQGRPSEKAWDISNSAPYMRHILHGVGEFGPGGQRILPKGARSQAFKNKKGQIGVSIKGKGGKVLFFRKEGEDKFRRWSRGYPGRPILAQINGAKGLKTAQESTNRLVKAEMKKAGL